MVSVRDITVEDVLQDDHVTVNVGQPLTTARSLMEESRLRALPVVDGERFAGMLSYRDVMEKLRSDPSTTKVDPLTHTPPEVEADQNLVELSSLRINSGRKMFVALDDRDRLHGVVGEEHIAYAAADTEELASASVADIMTQELVTTTADVSIETARRTMMDNNISRLVVLDDDGDLAGIISTLDTLRSMIMRDQMSGGTGNKGGRTPGTAAGEVKGEKGRLSDIPVREIMQSTVEIDAELVEPGTPLTDAIHRIEETTALEVVVMEDDEPVGLVTLKDVLDFIAAHEQVDSLLVELTGPEVPEEKKAIHDKIENRIKGGLGRVLERPEELRVHMKTYEKDGTRHKYTLNFRLGSELGTTRVNSHGWDLLDAVDEGLEKIETLIKKEKDKSRDEARRRRREGKYSSS